MKRLPVIAFSCALALGALAGCQSSFTQVLGDATVELKELDGTTEGDFDLPYTNVAYEVELESGTVDLEILDVVRASDDDDSPIPLDSIYEAKGLKSGESGTFTDDDGAIMVRLTSSDKATGKVSFKESE